MLQAVFLFEQLCRLGLCRNDWRKMLQSSSGMMGEDLFGELHAGQLQFGA